MAENNAVTQISRFFKKLTTSQKILFGAVIAGALIGIIVLVGVLNRPTFGVLYSNLGTEDAGKIVQVLKERKVPYQLEDDGKVIKVPASQIYDLRLSLASEGLPHSSVIGYEIFDRTNLGVSDFVQKINYRRALEGELARTILQLEEVEGARVHIAVPEKALFKEDEKPVTASVVLKLKSAKPLKQDIVQGIAHLVSSSVEGLDANNVRILDSRGVLLSENTKQNSLGALTSTQYELQQKVESYLSSKVQSLLERTVGMGNALVQVNADLDFRQIQRTMEEYDPDKTAIRSEQISEEKTPVSDTMPPATRSNTVTNYEVNKTVENIVESVGAINRLTVAAVVNGIEKKEDVNGEAKTEYIPRPQQDMEQLTELVKRAVGFSSERGDEVSVVNMQFGNGIHDDEFVYKQTPWTEWSDIIQKIFLIAAMIGAVLVLRSLLGRMKQKGTGEEETGEVFAQKASITQAAGKLQHKKASISLPSPEDEISEEALMREEKRKRVASYMKDKPDEAARLLKVWLSEEE
ncbi:MAG TPA: flagellar basal-body MS-ring/collar protein FliF [Bacteroidota bacterium]|nr:flagellar basal-body MS-ring/collar protein FliF [Bacteroidota bacterium]